MHTADDVYSIIDALPVAERWAVVEYTLHKIRDPNITESKDEPTTVDGKDKTATTYKHPILELAGIWSDAEAEEMKAAIEEDNKIDYDEW
jgi:hypothetical protein